MVRTYIQLNTGVVATLTVLKFIFAVIILFFVVSIRNWELLPAMRDQLLYLPDIERIMNDPSHLLLNDSYGSKRTLYSRVVGLFGALIPVSDLRPIIPAILLNTILQLLIAIFISRAYQLGGGKYPTVLFVVVLYSPTLSAYSFFAIRDLLIALMFSIFIVQTIKRSYISVSFSSLFLFFLRPLYLAYIVYTLFIVFMLDIYERFKQKLFFIIIIISSMVSLALGIIILLNFQWITNVFSRDGFVFSYFISTFGYGVFIHSQSADLYGHSSTVSMGIRFVMFDSLFIVPLSVLTALKIIKCKLGSDRTLSIVFLVLLFTLSFSYIAVQGNFPFRKIIPLVPVMYLIVFKTIDLLYDDKESHHVSHMSSQNNITATKD